MKKAVCLLGVSSSKQLAFTALFAALCAVSTVIITIPLPNGYFNTGDVFVLCSGWFLGPLYGPLAAAVGSALADIWCGFALYAPATFIIKGIDAFVAYTVWRFIKNYIQKEGLDFLPRVLSALLGELIMIAGYFLFEFVLYGLSGGIASLLGNALQAVCCAVLATAICSALYPVKTIYNLFPALQKKSSKK